MVTGNTSSGLAGAGQLRVHREDDATEPGKHSFVLRDEQGTEVARTPPFLPADAAARNARDRMLETLIGQGWEIAHAPDDTFGDPWWDYRFQPGPDASDQATLGQTLTAPGIPRARFGRKRRPRRQREQRQGPRVQTGMVVFLAFAVLMIILTITFILVVLWLLSS